jgi:chromosome segregation ATPase
MTDLLAQAERLERWDRTSPHDLLEAAAALREAHEQRIQMALAYDDLRAEWERTRNSLREANVTIEERDSELARALDVNNELSAEIERLKESNERAWANGAAFAKSAEEDRAEVERLRALRRSDIALAISYLGQIYGLIEEGELDKASELCRGAAESWTQDIAELDAELGEKHD